MKDKIRSEVLQLRKSMLLEDVEGKSKLIINSLIKSKEINNAKVIACYYPFQNEADLRGLIDSLLKEGKTILLPKIKQKMIKMYRINNLSDVHLGHFNIYEPDTMTEFEGVIDLIIVPLVAFNLKKDRIGFGKGYYDQFLMTHKSKTIGVAYEYQKFNFDSQSHDVPLDMIITEKGWYR